MRSRRVDSCLMRKRCNENNSLWNSRKLCCWRKLVGGKSLRCFGWRKGIIQSSSIVLWTHTVEHHWAFSGGSDRDQTIEFYQHLYTEAGVWRPLLDGMPFQLLMMRNLAGWIIALQRMFLKRLRIWVKIKYWAQMNSWWLFSKPVGVF